MEQSYMHSLNRHDPQGHPHRHATAPRGGLRTVASQSPTPHPYSAGRQPPRPTLNLPESLSPGIRSRQNDHPGQRPETEFQLNVRPVSNSEVPYSPDRRQFIDRPKSKRPAKYITGLGRDSVSDITMEGFEDPLTGEILHHEHTSESAGRPGLERDKSSSSNDVKEMQAEYYLDDTSTGPRGVEASRDMTTGSSNQVDPLIPYPAPYDKSEPRRLHRNEIHKSNRDLPIELEMREGYQDHVHLMSTPSVQIPPCESDKNQRLFPNHFELDEIIPESNDEHYLEQRSKRAEGPPRVIRGGLHSLVSEITLEGFRLPSQIDGSNRQAPGGRALSIAPLDGKIATRRPTICQDNCEDLPPTTRLSRPGPEILEPDVPFMKKPSIEYPIDNEVAFQSILNESANLSHNPSSKAFGSRTHSESEGEFGLNIDPGSDDMEKYVRSGRESPDADYIHEASNYNAGGVTTGKIRADPESPVEFEALRSGRESSVAGYMNESNYNTRRVPKGKIRADPESPVEYELGFGAGLAEHENIVRCDRETPTEFPLGFNNESFGGADRASKAKIRNDPVEFELGFDQGLADNKENGRNDRDTQMEFPLGFHDVSDSVARRDPNETLLGDAEMPTEFQLGFSGHPRQPARVSHREVEPNARHLPVKGNLQRHVVGDLGNRVGPPRTIHEDDCTVVSEITLEDLSYVSNCPSKPTLPTVEEFEVNGKQNAPVQTTREDTQQALNSMFDDAEDFVPQIPNRHEANAATAVREKVVDSPFNPINPELTSPSTSSADVSRGMDRNAPVDAEKFAVYNTEPSNHDSYCSASLHFGGVGPDEGINDSGPISRNWDQPSVEESKSSFWNSNIARDSYTSRRNLDSRLGMKEMHSLIDESSTPSQDNSRRRSAEVESCDQPVENMNASSKSDTSIDVDPAELERVLDVVPLATETRCRQLLRQYSINTAIVILLSEMSEK